MSELVTKEFLKAFGDKCKKIFKPQTTVVNTPDDNEYKYLIINTDLPWLDTWVVNIDISGKGFTNTYNNYYGDIKFFGNISNQGNWEGRGYSLVDNEVIGILIDNYLSGVEYKTRFVIQFFEPVKQVAIDIINYLGDNTSNVNINSVEFISSLGGNFSYAYILGNIDYQSSTIGKIIRLEQQSEVEQFLFKLPKQNDDSDLDGDYINIPEDTTQIDSVNDSKWAKYLKTKYNIKLEEGDLKGTTISFGGDNNTEINVSPLEINNFVQGNTEGEWFGKVQVNSKGLVTAVDSEEPLQAATDTILGGIQIGFEAKPIDKKYPVELDENNNAYVHVPWNDTDTWNKVATESDLGLIKLGFEEDGKKYPVELNSDNKAYVEVPWTDTITEIPEASDTTSGTIKLGYEENDKNYPIEVNDQGQAFVNVPWESGENGTYDIATADTAGLIKVGLNSNVWWENAVKLDVNGNAYVNVGTPVYTSNIKGSNVTKEFSYGFNNYEYTIIDPDSISKSTIDIVLRAINGCEFKGVLNKIHRISNQSQYTATIKVSNNTGTTLCNMFDAQITSNTGLELPAGQTLELVFTFWDVNDVSFNGGFSV